MIEVALVFGSAFFIFRLIRGVSDNVEEKKEIISKKDAVKHVKEMKEEFVVKKGIDDILSKADRLFKADAFRNAEELYIEAVREDPKDARAYRGLSKVYIKQDNENDAIASLEKVCELDPSDDTSFNNLGLMYFKKKNYLKAIDNYEKSLALDKSKSHRYVNFALALKEARDYKKAANALEKAVKIEPKKETYNMLIEVYEKMGETEMVKKTYKKLLEIDPKNKEAKRAMAKGE